MTRKSQSRRSKRGRVVVSAIPQTFVYPAAPYKEPVNDYPLVTRAIREVFSKVNFAKASAQWRRQIALVTALHKAAAAKAANQSTVEM